MSTNIRKAPYGPIPAVVVAILTVCGVLTDLLAVLWGNVLTLAVDAALDDSHIAARAKPKPKRGVARFWGTVQGVGVRG